MSFLAKFLCTRDQLATAGIRIGKAEQDRPPRCQLTEGSEHRIRFTNGILGKCHRVICNQQRRWVEVDLSYLRYFGDEGQASPKAAVSVESIVSATRTGVRGRAACCC